MKRLFQLPKTDMESSCGIDSAAVRSPLVQTYLNRAAWCQLLSPEVALSHAPPAATRDQLRAIDKAAETSSELSIKLQRWPRSPHAATEPRPELRRWGRYGAHPHRLRCTGWLDNKYDLTYTDTTRTYVNSEVRNSLDVD